MPEINSGDHHWSNLDSLILDAAKSRQAVADARAFRILIAAIALDHPGLTVSKKTLAICEDKAERDRVVILDAPALDQVMLTVRGK